MVGLLDAAGRRQACIVGHDWGGIVAWYLAAHYPQRVARASILNVPHPAVVGRSLWRVPDQLLRSWYILFFQLPGLPEWLLRRRNWRWGEQALRRSSRPGTFSAAEVARYKGGLGAAGSRCGHGELVPGAAPARWGRVAAHPGAGATHLGQAGCFPERAAG